MMMMRHRLRPIPRSFVLGPAVAVVLGAALALAADATPIDRASEQISLALSVLKDAKGPDKEADEHLEKARTLLARGRAELLKAQGREAAK